MKIVKRKTINRCYEMDTHDKGDLRLAKIKNKRKKRVGKGELNATPSVWQ